MQKRNHKLVIALTIIYIAGQLLAPPGVKASPNASLTLEITEKTCMQGNESIPSRQEACQKSDASDAGDNADAGMSNKLHSTWLYGVLKSIICIVLWFLLILALVIALLSSARRLIVLPGRRKKREQGKKAKKRKAKQVIISSARNKRS